MPLFVRSDGLVHRGEERQQYCLLLGNKSPYLLARPFPRIDERGSDCNIRSSLSELGADGRTLGLLTLRWKMPSWWRSAMFSAWRPARVLKNDDIKRKTCENKLNIRTPGK